jgi:hypothetical protein
VSLREHTLLDRSTRTACLGCLGVPLALFGLVVLAEHVGLSAWVAFWVTFVAWIFFVASGGSHRAASRSVPIPTVPDGIVAPPGRTFSVVLEPLGGGVQDGRVSLSVTAAVELSLERAKALTPNEAFFGLRPPVTGDTSFDARFHLEGARIDREARRALAEIFDEFRASKIECRDGRLTATVPEEQLPRPGRYTFLLREMATAARALERVPLDVKILGGERQALAGEHGAARCSYCHAELTGSEPDLVACGSCSTVLHEGCWAELKRCPVLGCRGTVPERARERS